MASFVYQATLLCLIGALAEVDSLAPPTATVVCAENGFSPNITQDVTNATIKLQVVIGTGGTGCQSTEKLLNASDTTVSIVELNNNTIISYNHTCGATLEDNVINGSRVNYINTIKVVQINVLRNTIVRKTAFNFALNCTLQKNPGSSLTAEGNFTVNDSIANIPSTDSDSVNGTFELGTELKFHADANYNSTMGSTFTVNHGQTLYLQVNETSGNDLFKFAVKECWSTPDSSPTNVVKDTFFTNMCPVDNTVSFVDGEQSSHKFSFQMTAFAFNTDYAAAVYIHCRLFVCRNDDMDAACVQKSQAQCPSSRRKRRNADDNLGEMLVSSRQTFTVDNSQLFVPTCDDGFVFDRVNKECTNERTMRIRDIYLDQEWDPRYADTTSEAFRDMARERSLQLYTMQREAYGYIQGIKVERATRGSVILDTLVTYDKEVSAKVAFEAFERLLRDSSASGRIRSMLKLREDKTIEFVPILEEQRSGKTDGAEKLTLISIVCVLLVILVITMAGFVHFMRSRRSPSPNPQAATGVDNKGVALDTFA